MKPWWSCIEQVCEFSKNKTKSIFKAWECTECPKEVWLAVKLLLNDAASLVSHHLEYRKEI